MEKRLIVAIAASVLIIVSFQYISLRTNPPKASPPPAATSVRQNIAAPVEESTSPLPDESEIAVSTKHQIITFSNMGGSIKKVTMLDYKENGSTSPLVLADLKESRHYIFAATDTAGAYDLDRISYEPTKTADGAIYTAKTKGLEISKEYKISNYNNIIELNMVLRNISDTPKELGIEVVTGAGLKESSSQDHRFIEATAKIDGKYFGYKKPKERSANLGIVTWAALKNKYFSFIAKPFGQTKGVFTEIDKNEGLFTGIEMLSVMIPPGSFIEQKFIVYSGQSSLETLKSVGYEFDESVNYGFFGGISKALLVVLRWCHRITGNWGVSVIFLSIFLNVILFPLSSKSFKSMQKMQALHPQMEKLKAQHKDSPQKLNKEMMELYKTNGVNPFGGCLPLLLQMPIFFALYAALVRSIELRGAGFLWVKDLSLPDAVQIPATLPLIGSSINILPILMVIATVIQQKLSTNTMGTAVTSEQKQQQQMMLYMMPVMFLFIFYSMPSGLVLYWLINTTLTAGEQFLIFKPKALTSE